MSKEQEFQTFKQSSQTQLSPLDSSRQSLKEHTNHSNTQTVNNNNSSSIPINRVRHVYLEEQNTYGRFVPFLLLKDKIKNDYDNSGHTALHHMCSHNSQYLPLYLSSIPMNDPILNKPSKVGHTPLDVAGIYCRKQYVDLLRQRGAIDKGNVDHWAIQGGNIYNWTGNVDVNKKHLIHWAAYNDMPQVLAQFYKQGANLNQKDGNDFSPIDLAIINKSYNSIKFLASLGLKPKLQLIIQAQSKSIKRIFEQIDQPKQQKDRIKLFKSLFVPLFCLLSFILITQTNQNTSSIVQIPLVITFLLWAFLRYCIKVQTQPRYQNSRYTAFYSDIISSQVNLKSNHFYYLLLNLMICITGITAILSSRTTNYLVAVLYFVEIYITIVFVVNTFLILYGISQNLTHQELFDSYKCKYLWKQIHYIAQKRILMRKFNNPINRGFKQNFKRYFSRNVL